MAEDSQETEEITALCSGLNINIGMINDNKLKAMLLAGKKANELNHPVVLDPVGTGASEYRTRAALTIIDNIRLTAIRGNISEMKAIARAVNESKSNINNLLYNPESKGVEVSDIDRVTEDNLSEAVRFAGTLARQLDTVICMTGRIDVVTDGRVVYCIRNGNPMMGKVTGEGCQLSVLTTAYVTAVHSIMNEDNAADDKKIIRAAAAAVCVMGISGEIAYERMGRLDGNASYRNYIIDAVYNMTDEILEDRCRVEVMNYE